MVSRRILLLLVLPFLFLFTSCHIVRYFYWNFADINDYKKFQSVPVHTGEDHYYFKVARNPVDLQLPAGCKGSKPGQGLNDFLKENKSVAFLVIRRDTILYEKYLYGYDSSSVIPSFSVSKTFVSALVGIAIKEGYIKSVEQTVSEFLPDMKDPGFKNVRILDLLNMRSGIKWQEKYASPFALMPKFYYGTNLKRYARNLKIQEPPDLHYNYESVNTFLLGQILEKATGTPINVYLENKIWKPLGMETDATWSIDSKKHKAVKSFCCLNARTHDFARFGRLYLHKGNWNGNQIVPADWVKQSQTITRDSRDSQGYSYQYQWRITPSGQLFAKGVLGQFIFLDPSREIIIVRLGKSTGKADWPSLFRDLIHQL